MTTTGDVRVTAADFEWFRDFFAKRTGIYFEDTKRYFVDRRLEARVKATQQTSCAMYFSLLQYEASQTEFQVLVNSMTVNETYFYREQYQLKSMVDEMMDDVLRRKGRSRPIRIWSMPCSTGEEPYSIGLYLLENWPRISEVDVEIVGSDINSDVLQSCRNGVYSAYAMRELPKQVGEKYFRQVGPDAFQISEALRGAVTFNRVNLADSKDIRGFRDFDLVFCRNLLIYFNDVTRREAVENIYGAMNPGGYIFLGHSESMSRISPLFKVAAGTSSLVYQKPL
jgi:chemotaxis protein methyltransferase CheR